MQPAYVDFFGNAQPYSINSDTVALAGKSAKNGKNGN